jgi:hypothetical protein
MPWDELKQELRDQKAVFAEGNPVWTVTGTNHAAFRAHPAFLDAVRIAGSLPDLVTATDGTFITAIRDWRVTLDSHLAEVPAVRTALGLAANRFTTLDEQVALLRYNDTARSQPGSENPVISAAATAFADRQHAPTVGDFTQLHAFFLAAAASFGKPYDAHTYPGRVDALYALAIGSPAAVAAGRIRLGAEADWRTHQAGFALNAHAEGARLNFGTGNALVGHALKHTVRGNPQIPTDRAGMENLVAAYLKDARDNVIATVPATVTSALAQNGGARTYLFGIVRQHATTVAVDSSGDAWISTYYGPNRL